MTHQPGYHWTTLEVAALRRTYPDGGSAAARQALPRRTEQAIRHMARRLGIHCSSAIYATSPRVHLYTTPKVDAALRAGLPQCHTRVALAGLATQVGRPVWWVCKRGAQLGIVTPRQASRHWQPAELAVLRPIASTHCLADIAAALQAAGHARSVPAIQAQIQRLGLPRAARTTARKPLA